MSRIALLISLYFCGLILPVLSARPSTYFTTSPMSLANFVASLVQLTIVAAVLAARLPMAARPTVPMRLIFFVTPSNLPCVPLMAAVRLLSSFPAIWIVRLRIFPPDMLRPPPRSFQKAPGLGALNKILFRPLLRGPGGLLLSAALYIRLLL